MRIPALALALVLALGTLLPVFPVHAATGGLDDLERAAVASVDRQRAAGEALLERSVNINSGTMNFAGVRAVARVFEPEFRALGFRVEWVDGAAFGRAGHLIARREAKEPAPTSGAGPRLLLIGHLDTVFERDSPFQRYTRTSDSTASGPGTIDMKGGVVVILLALRALADAGELDALPVTVVLTGDEEKAGEPLELARRDLVAAARWADVAIGFEDGAGDPKTAVTARRGATSWVLKTSGKPAHSSQIFKPDVGSGAIYECARILEAFRDSLGSEEYLTFNPGVLVGGTAISFDPEANRGSAFGKTNVVAESTTVAGDLRALTIEQRERAKATMRRIVAQNLPRTGASIEFSDGYPPLAPSDGNRRLLALYDGASRDLGFGPVASVDPSRAGAADVAFTAGLVDMALDGVGLMGTGGHTIQEVADLRTLPSQAKRMAVTLVRLHRAWSGVQGRTP